MKYIYFTDTPAWSGFYYAILHNRLLNGNIIGDVTTINFFLLIYLKFCMYFYLSFLKQSIFDGKIYFVMRGTRKGEIRRRNFKNWTSLYRASSVLHMHWRALKYFWNYLICVKGEVLTLAKKTTVALLLKPTSSFHSFLMYLLLFQTQKGIQGPSSLPVSVNDFTFFDNLAWFMEVDP